MANSPRSMPNVAARAANSDESETPLISRSSVFTVTRKRRRRNRSMGWSARLATAPVWTFEVGHISSGTRRSRTKAASRPSRTDPSGSCVMSSTRRTPWPRRSAPHHCSASQMDGSPKLSPVRTSRSSPFTATTSS